MKRAAAFEDGIARSVSFGRQATRPPTKAAAGAEVAGKRTSRATIERSGWYLTPRGVRVIHSAARSLRLTADRHPPGPAFLSKLELDS